MLAVCPTDDLRRRPLARRLLCGPDPALHTALAVWPRPEPLQTTLAVGVAEEACQFEHRDLHWGNLLIRRDEAAAPQAEAVNARLRGVELQAATAGVTVSGRDACRQWGRHRIGCHDRSAAVAVTESWLARQLHRMRALPYQCSMAVLGLSPLAVRCRLGVASGARGTVWPQKLHTAPCACRTGAMHAVVDHQIQSRNSFLCFDGSSSFM